MVICPNKIKGHTNTHTPSCVESNLIHFPQTRGSHDRIWQKLVLQLNYYSVLEKISEITCVIVVLLYVFIRYMFIYSFCQPCICYPRKYFFLKICHGIMLLLLPTSILYGIDMLFSPVDVFGLPLVQGNFC